MMKFKHTVSEQNQDIEDNICHAATAAIADT